MIITGVIYFNIKILVPLFLVTGKLIRYILSIGISALFVMILIIIVQNLFFDITETDKIESPLINLMGNILSLGMIIASTSIYVLFREWSRIKMLTYYLLKMQIYINLLYFATINITNPNNIILLGFVIYGRYQK